VILPVYTGKHHKYPVLDLHSSKVFIPNFEALSGTYWLIDRRPFQSVKVSSVALFWFGHQWHCFGLADTEFGTLFSNNISQDKF